MTEQNRLEAIEHYNRGDARTFPEDAIDDYDKAIQLDPGFAEAYYARGLAYSYIKDGDHDFYDYAIDDFDEAIRLNPNYAKAYMRRGDTYADMGNPDLAIADYNEAMRLDPKYAYPYMNRGDVHFDKKQGKALAFADYEKAIQLDPRNVKLYLHRANRYVLSGNYVRAVADYKTVLRIDPKNVRAKAHIKELRERIPFLEEPPSAKRVVIYYVALYLFLAVFGGLVLLIHQFLPPGMTLIFIAAFCVLTPLIVWFMRKRA